MRALAAALLLCVLPLVALAQEPSLHGRWMVGYIDLLRGKVEGEAFIDEQSGQVEVTYRFRDNGETLRANGTVSRSEDGIEIVLRGAVPAAALPLVAPGLVLPSEPLRFALGEGALEVTPGPAPSGDGTLRLSFAFTSDGQGLSGLWRHRVDPVTGADRNGAARGGRFELLYDGTGAAEFIGVESWRRPRARLITAFALEDQQADIYGEASWPTPYDAAGKVVRALANLRTIFVLGEDLPIEYRDRLEIESLDPGIDYQIYRLYSDFGRNVDADWPREKGFALLEKEVGAERMEQLRARDVVILRATIAPGTAPGPKTFRLNGAEGAWMLQYGDWRGRLQILRPIGFSQTDRADFIYPQEAIHLEVFLDKPVPLTEIPLLLGAVTGEEMPRLARIGGKRELIARQDPEEPRRYLTDPIVLAEAPYDETYPEDTAVLRVAVGDKVFAQLATDAVVLLRPALAAAQVVSSPRHVSAALTGDPAARNLSWQDVLTQAGACKGLTAPDLKKVGDQEADDFENLIAFAFTVMETKVSIGQHAAMLLLRQTFLDLLTAQAKSFRAELSDEAILGFRATLDGAIFDEHWPLGSRKVAAPGGGTISFAKTFAEELMERDHGLSGAALEAYQVQATREARLAYAEAIEATRASAAAIETCDIDDLLFLTGFDFAGVKGVAKQLAVALVEEELTATFARPTWVADRRARAWLDQVEIVASTLKDQRALAAYDNDLILTALFLATLPLAFVEAPAALVVMLVVDAGDALITAGRTLYNQLELRAETRFALGASAVIGAERFHRAEARKYEWFKGYLMTLAAAGGAAFSSFELYEGLLTAGQRAAVKRGQEVAERLAREPDPLSAARRLTDEERALLLDAILSAQSVLRRLGDDALEQGEAAAARLASTLADPPPPSRLPEWASHLDRATYKALGPLVDQPHVIAFFARFPARMAELAADPLARDLLYLPWRSFDEFVGAVTRARSREGPQGRAFYEQIDPAGRSPPGIYFERMIGVDANKVGERVVAYNVISAADDQMVARYIRRLGPDDTQETGGLEFTLDLIRNEPGIARELRFVKGLPQPLTKDGMPMTLYLNLRAMRELGLEFADPRLTVVKFSNMIGVESCVQMHWLRQAYPDLPWSELLRRTPHYRYAQAFLEQAGYRIKEVRIDQEQWLIEDTILSHVALGWMDPAHLRKVGSGYELNDAGRDFLGRYGLKPEDEITFGYDGYVLVEPLGP